MTGKWHSDFTSLIRFQGLPVCFSEAGWKFATTLTLTLHQMAELNLRAGTDTVHQLNLLTQEDLADLADYATRRLKRVGLTALEGEDIAQDALQAILEGLEEAKQGRHPRACDVASKLAFMDYVGGVINSLVTVERRKAVHDVKHYSVTRDPRTDDETPQPELATTESVTGDVAISDLQSAFFARLWPRACPAMTPHLQEWEATWRRSDQIPVPIPQRRLRGKIKVLAREVLSEIGEELAA